MQMEIRLNSERREPTVILEAAALTPEVEALAKRLRAVDTGTLTGFRDERAYRLNPGDIVRFYASEKEVYAETVGRDAYAVKQRLYELESSLDRHDFVRISHSEIVNLRQVRAMDLKLSGTIQMTMNGGVVCYASRRYVKKIKEALGL